MKQGSFYYNLCAQSWLTQQTARGHSFTMYAIRAKKFTNVNGHIAYPCILIMKNLVKAPLASFKNLFKL